MSLSQNQPRLILRDFTPEDYPAITRIANAVYDEYPATEEEMRFRDTHRDPKCRFHRWVAVGANAVEADAVEADAVGADAVVGFGEHDQHSMMYHPRKFSCEILVPPKRQGQGIGRSLYERVLGALAPFDPILLRSMAREDKPRSARFLSDRGFEEDRRAWESRLDPRAFDFARYAGHVESVLTRGIRIQTFGELAGDPERMRKIQALDWEASQDVPLSDPPTPVPEEVYAKGTLEHPGLVPDAFFIALDGDQYVGMSNLWASQANEELYTGFTGVARAYRRRGIALALKLKAVAWARERGSPCVKTWNDSTNRPMLSINEAFGFVRQPAWILFHKKLQDEVARDATAGPDSRGEPVP